MKLYLQDADLTIYCGDVLEVLRELPDESVDCCVTSPPYWGLRDYGVDGQLGLEATPELYVERMVEVFREVRRVLAKHGTCWVNMGDSYATNPGNGRGGGEAVEGGIPHYSASNKLGRGLKPKDLCGIPWRVAFALQADGWWLRSEIIWAKPNPMPESVTDRPTKAHEQVFLLTKAPRYYFDQEAVREAYEGDPEYRYGRVGAYQERAISGIGDGTTPTRIVGPDGRHKTTVQGADGSIQHRDGERWPNGGRNIRTVWEIATQPFPLAHFATYPEELVRRCILAGCPEPVCRVCGKPRERIVDVEYENPGGRTTNGPRSLAQRHETAGFETRLEKRTSTSGWTSCECADYRPGVVLDPFLGSGTTALVARKHGRHAIGIELSPDYCAMAAKRLAQLSLLAESGAA